MHHGELPQAQGLYDPQHEKDACGVGFVAHLRGRKSHDIVKKGLRLLCNLEHRGASGSEANTGDGAGILIQMPDRFFRERQAELGFDAPSGRRVRGRPGLPAARSGRARRRQGRHRPHRRRAGPDAARLAHACRPTTPRSGCVRARSSRSSSRFSSARWPRRSGPKAASGASAFERALYVIRKRLEKAVDALDPAERALFYVVSLSSSTLIYKGMLTAAQIAPMFPDLSDPSLESALALVHQRFSTNTFPSWPLAHPYRYVAHNGEINTLRGNINWMRAREGLLAVGAVRQGTAAGPARHPRRRLGHGDVRQRARVPLHGGPVAAARRADDDSRAVAEPRGDERRAPRVLRVPLVADGAVGRPGGHRLHRRQGDRRRARSQRPAPVALLHHEGRHRRHGVGSRRARLRAGEHRRQGAAASRQGVPGRHREGPDRRRRGAEGRAGGGAPVRRVGQDPPEEHRRPAGGARRCPSPITPRCCAASWRSATRTKTCAC